MFLETERIIVVDTETRSQIDLQKSGAAVYFSDPSTEVLMTGVGMYDGAVDRPIKVYDHKCRQEGVPEIIYRALDAPAHEVQFCAANAAFDQKALRLLGVDVPDDRWIDVLTLSRILGFTGGVDAVLKQTGVGYEKDKTGKHCISVFSVQNKEWHDFPDLYDSFLAYCAHDVRAERALLHWCLQWLNQPWMAPVVREILEQDRLYMRVNDRGIPIDTERSRARWRSSRRSRKS